MINWFEKNKGFSILMTILIVIEIFCFSSLPGSTITSGSNWPARIYHFTIFFLFTFFLFNSVKRQEKIKGKHLLLVLIITILQAILDEVHQMFVPFRGPSMVDILTNTVGIFSSMIIYIFINKKLSERKV